MCEPVVGKSVGSKSFGEAIAVSALGEWTNESEWRRTKGTGKRGFTAPSLRPWGVGLDRRMWYV